MDYNRATSKPLLNSVREEHNNNGIVYIEECEEFYNNDTLDENGDGDQEQADYQTRSRKQFDKHYVPSEGSNMYKNVSYSYAQASDMLPHSSEQRPKTVPYFVNSSEYENGRYSERHKRNHHHYHHHHHKPKSAVTLPPQKHFSNDSRQYESNSIIKPMYNNKRIDSEYDDSVDYVCQPMKQRYSVNNQHSRSKSSPMKSAVNHSFSRNHNQGEHKYNRSSNKMVEHICDTIKDLNTFSRKSKDQDHYRDMDQYQSVDAYLTDAQEVDETDKPHGYQGTTISGLGFNMDSKYSSNQGYNKNNSKMCDDVNLIEEVIQKDEEFTTLQKAKSVMFELVDKEMERISKKYKTDSEAGGKEPDRNKQISLQSVHSSATMDRRSERLAILNKIQNDIKHLQQLEMAEQIDDNGKCDGGKNI